MAGCCAAGCRVLSGLCCLRRHGDLRTCSGGILRLLWSGGCAPRYGAPGHRPLCRRGMPGGGRRRTSTGIIDVVATQPWAGIPFIVFRGRGGRPRHGDDRAAAASRGPGRSVTVRLVDAGSRFLASRTSRRGFLRNAALVGSALATAPGGYALRPVSAYSAICSCSGLVV